MGMMTQERYEAIKERYWVLGFRKENASVFDWLYSPNSVPRPVLNPSMQWRKPTFVEVLERQQAYEADPAYFKQRAAERSIELRKYDAS